MGKTLVLTSQSKVKESAIRKGLANRMHEDFDLLCVATGCDNPEQPVNSSYTCAENRLHSYLNDHKSTHPDLIINVENIINVNEDTCEDVCTIVLHNTTCGTNYKASSFPVKFDKKYYNKAQLVSKLLRSDGFNCTVGEIINAENEHVPADNWVSWATNGQWTREDQILDAFNQCFDLYVRSQIKDNLLYFQDFPKKGVLYQSLNKVINDGLLFNYLIDLTVNVVKKLPNFGQLTKIIGLDSRGYIFGAPLALRLGCGFVRACKAGKEPGDKYQIDYKTEYSSAQMEMMKGLIDKNDSVIIIDDLVATGGTFGASAELVNQSGGNILACVSIVKVDSLFDIACEAVGLPIHVVL